MEKKTKTKATGGSWIRSVEMKFALADDVTKQKEGIRMSVIPVVHTGQSPLYALKYDIPFDTTERATTEWVVSETGVVYSRKLPETAFLFDDIRDAVAFGMDESGLNNTESEWGMSDVEGKSRIVSPDRITQLVFTCGAETKTGEGSIRVAINPYCYFENMPLWVVTYESTYSGVRPAFLVHADEEPAACVDYLPEPVKYLYEPPREMAMFDDLTTAMVAGMKRGVVDTYEALVEDDLRAIHEKGKGKLILTREKRASV